MNTRRVFLSDQRGFHRFAKTTSKGNVWPKRYYVQSFSSRIKLISWMGWLICHGSLITGSQFLEPSYWWRRGKKMTKREMSWWPVRWCLEANKCISMPEPLQGRHVWLNGAEMIFKERFCKTWTYVIHKPHSCLDILRNIAMLLPKSSALRATFQMTCLKQRSILFWKKRQL